MGDDVRVSGDATRNRLSSITSTLGIDVPHFFLPVRPESNEQASRRVAEQFCGAYERQYDQKSHVVDVEHDNVDAIIDIAGSQIAIEVTSYVQRDEYYEVESRDSDFKTRLSTRLGEAGLGAFSIHVNWRQASRLAPAGGESRTCAKIPRQMGVLEIVVEELVALAGDASTNERLVDHNITFWKSERNPSRRALRGELALDPGAYPNLADSISSILINVTPLAQSASISTSADARSIGLDDVQLRDVATNKLEKLPKYRSKNRDRSLWLVIHCDWNRMSTILPEAHRHRAFGVIRDAVQNARDRFDKIWWAEKTGYLDVAELFLVWPLESGA